MQINDYQTEDFINKVLIADIKKLIDTGFEFFAFILVCQGIEYLGSFFDSEDLKEFGNLKTDLQSLSKIYFPIAFIKIIRNGYLKI